MATILKDCAVYSKLNLLMNRYYLHDDRISFTKGRYILRNSPVMEVSINENIDRPSVKINFSRLKEKSFKRPENTEWETFKEIKEDDFYNYLSVSLDVFRKLKWKEFEVYFEKLYSTCLDFVLFSNNPKYKYQLRLEINCKIDFALVELYYGHTLNRRPYYRKHGTSIPIETFIFLFSKFIEFVEDDQNYINNIEALYKLCIRSSQGDIKPECSSNKIDISPLLTEISNKIQQLESRLITNDSDRKETRAKLRGKVEGLKASLYEIKHFFKDI